MRKNLVIATRGSQLALWQAEHVKACLESLEPAGLRRRPQVFRKKLNPLRRR